MKKIAFLAIVSLLLAIPSLHLHVGALALDHFKTPPYEMSGDSSGGGVFHPLEELNKYECASSADRATGEGYVKALSEAYFLWAGAEAWAWSYMVSSWKASSSGLHTIVFFFTLDGMMITKFGYDFGAPPTDLDDLGWAFASASLEIQIRVYDKTEDWKSVYNTPDPEMRLYKTNWYLPYFPFKMVPPKTRYFDEPYHYQLELNLVQDHVYAWVFEVKIESVVSSSWFARAYAGGEIRSKLNEVRIYSEAAPSYDLDVAVSAPDSVGRDNIFSVTANVENVQGGDMHNVMAELYLPSGLSLISGANPQNLGTILSGGSDFASWSVSGDSDGSWTLAVEAWCDEGATDIDHKTVDVIPPSPTYYIEVIAGVTDKPIIVGQEFDVIAEVENEGGGDVHNVLATLNLPSGLSLISGSNPQDLGTIPVYDSAWANWVVRADSPSQYTLSVEATCDEGATDMDYEPANVVEPAPLSIDLVSSDRTVEDLRFRVLAYVTNEGEIWAYNLTATLTLPSGLELVGGDPNPEFEEKMYPGEVWTLSWYLKGVAGNYIVSIDVESEEGSHVSAEKEIEVYSPPSDVYLFWNYTVQNDIRSVATGDIDGDGIGDIAIGSRGDVHAIKSDGTLLWNFTTDSDLVMSLDIGDLDGDGKGEVAAGCSDGHVYAFDSPSEGQIGVLMWKKIAYTHSCDPYIYDIETGDFDGDGKDDVVSAAANGYSDVFAFRGFDGHKLWSHALDWEFLSISYMGDSLGIGDIDGDGKNDVAVAIMDITTPITGIFAYRGYDGLNLWGSEQYGYPTEEEIFAVDVGDLNGDGKGEVVAGGHEWVVYALRHTSTGSPPSVFWTRLLPSAQIRSIKVGDLDGDGDNDVAVGTRKINGDNVVGLYGSDGNFIWSLPLENYVRDIDIGDFDGDGISDVAAGGEDANLGGKARIWVIRSPDGSPIGSYTLGGSISWQGLEMGDINGDGSSDVAVGSYDDFLHVLTCSLSDAEGPTTGFPVISPDPTNINPTANATIVDSLSNIVAAEYFIGVTGADGTGTPMNPLDGSFDSKSEIVTASIDISSLSDGSHLVLVHGKDNAGNWGDFVVASFTVDRTSPTITIISPQNKTYTERLLQLNVTSDEPVDTWWFSLNGASNFTFSPNATIPSSWGSNDLVVYANDTTGNVGSEQVSWTVKRTTNLNLSLSSHFIREGATITIACSICAPVNDGKATIQFSEDQTTWFNISSGAPTVGIYATNWTSLTSGLLYLRGIWTGDSDYEGCLSTIQELNVGFGVGIVDSQILDALSNTVYFIYADPTYMTRAEATYDVASGEIVRGLCVNTQNYGFNTTKYWLLDTGAINPTTISEATIAMFGGPYPHVAVRYYEDSHVGSQQGNWLAPVKFAENATHYWFVNQTDAIVGILPISAVRNGHEDLFVIEVFMDGDNTILVVYGFDWKGTWAGGIYFEEVMSESLSDYSNVYYILHWVDDIEQDGIPQSSEIYLEASG